MDGDGVASQGLDSKSSSQQGGGSVPRPLWGTSPPCFRFESTEYARILHVSSSVSHPWWSSRCLLQYRALRRRKKTLFNPKEARPRGILRLPNGIPWGFHGRLLAAPLFDNPRRVQNTLWAKHVVVLFSGSQMLVRWWAYGGERARARIFEAKQQQQYNNLVRVDGTRSKCSWEKVPLRTNCPRLTLMTLSDPLKSRLAYLS